MIVSWIHKGLKDFFETGSMAGIQAEHAKRLRVRLEILNAIRSLDEMNYPSFRLHALQGDRKGIWSITVTKNWRITFKFEDGNVYIVNYEDYH
ncbi:type II toxin-antitoxin system RelE/ParE family toxin [Sutterella wadsworthensis]|jgi:proteic killer suppression protein|uniref:type II toxin-antitoxin system RelE/ParE family toxin n=1 Tax=Sutterella wadsworthensis TaxID=40545 RepID=UPI0001F604D2|nr:type II toxin-antitoxin system RelE/ParE family toxin [Sutterella wadsworthensis]EFW01050.1 plasmid maintenance system killer [Sutterella wadsworthensis 3_1_45B]